MLTRRQAKLRGEVITPTVFEELGRLPRNTLSPARPPRPSTTNIAALSDLSLTLIFSFLTPFDLLPVSQVCHRWRGLCESRSLWSGRTLSTAHKDDHPDGFERVLRVLRRPHGVARYCELRLDFWHGYKTQSASFKVLQDKGLQLEVQLSSSLMLHHALRQLLARPGVATLWLTEFGGLTSCEAYTTWQAVADAASRVHLEHLCLRLDRDSSMHLSKFRWPSGGRAASLRAVTFSLARPPLTRPAAVCIPVQSLLKVHRRHLRTVYIQTDPEDQPALLRECPGSLESLQARLTPQMLMLLCRSNCLRYLYVSSADDGVTAEEVVPVLLLARGLRSLAPCHLLQLEVDLGQNGSCEQLQQQALAAVSRCTSLKWVKLYGFGRLLADPARGPPAVRGLLAGLTALLSLHLDAAACAFPFTALLPEEEGAAPLSAASLTLLRLDGACTCIPPTSRVPTPWPAYWPSALASALDRRPALHVATLPAAGRRHAELLLQQGRQPALSAAAVEAERKQGVLLVLPHPAAVSCQTCPPFIGNRIHVIGSKVYIGDCLRKSS